MDASRKTTLKLKSDFHLTELDQSACQSSPIYQEHKAHFEMKAPGQSCPTDFPYPGADATHSQGDQSQQSFRALVGSRALVRPHSNVFESSLRSASNSPKKQKKAVTHQDDTVFEVPSSDSEQSIRLNASGRLLKRKRRNGRPGHIPDESGSAGEDVGLQRHAATELRMGQLLSPGARKIGSPISSDIEYSSRAATSMISFPLTSLSRATTPRQKELWNLLSNDCERKTAHSHFSSSSSRSKECDKAKFKRSGLPSMTSNLTKPVSGVLPTRRRLVDNLHQTDDSFMKGVDSLEDGGGSILSPKKPAPSSRNENASRVGSAAASKLELVPIVTQLHGAHDHIYVVPGTGHPAPLQPSGALKVTYARERSFLTDDDVSQQGCFDAARTSELAPDARRQRRVARDSAIFQKPEVLTGDLDEVSEYQGSAMRSIHELREAGGNARVFSEMEAILDDIDEASASSLTVKRSKLLELAIKLQELSFCRLFSDQGLDQRVFAQLVPTKDVLVDTLVAITILSLLASSASTSKLHQMRVSRVIGFMIGLLDRNQDLAFFTRKPTFNISRVAQGQFKILWDLLSKSTTWRVGRPTVLTPRVIALQCLEYIVRRIRESGCVDPVLSAGDIRSIVQLLQADPSAETQQQQSSLNAEIHLSVSILESWTICNDPSCKDTIWTDHTLGIVIGLLSRLDSLAKADVGTLRTLTLRLYLNLTNNNPELCTAFSKPAVIGSMLNIVVSHFQSLSEATTQDMPEVMLDNLILALGSMINLAEWSDAVRLIVMRLEFMHTSFIDILLQLFLRKQKTAAEVRPYLWLSYVGI